MTSSTRSGRIRRIVRNKGNKGDGWDEFGGYMAAKVQKLENQFAEEKKDSAVASLTNIFNGISIFVNGYTKPSSDVLKKLMQQHGGAYHHYYARHKVTHIIASNLPNSKVANLTDKKVCHPDWITESIKAGKLLPYQDFLLYKAETKRQPSLKLTRGAAAASGKNDDADNGDTLASGDVNEGSSKSLQQIVSPNDESKSATVIKKDVLNANSEKSKDAESNIPETNIKSMHKSPPSGLRSPAKAGDPNFLSEFYGRSRLHHISAWGSEMKAYVKTLQAKPADFEAREKLVQIVKERDISCSSGHDVDSMAEDRVIMHIDMDSFFVSVGVRNKPELVGKPVAVTHSKGKAGTSKEAEKAGYRGSMAEIASCSYEARKCGVKNGMLLGGARELCPDLVCIPYDFDGYSEVSHKLYDLVSSYTHEIEAVSCDEMFVDCTEVLADTSATPLEFASLLRQEIKEATRCNASAGLGSNILLARLATRKAKPNGQYYVSQAEADIFMQDIPVTSLPGVGRTIRDKLLSIGVSTCRDLLEVNMGTLQRELGQKTGQTLYNYSRGKDDRMIQSEKARKSVSAEVNYGIRFTKAEEAERFVHELAEEVAKRLIAVSAKGKSITLKLKVRQKDAPIETPKFMGCGRCDNFAKSVALSSFTNDAALIAKESSILLKALQPPVSDIRGMGVQVSKLDTAETAPSTAGVRSILQFTTKLPKQAERKSPDPTEPDDVDAHQGEASAFKIPEPKPKELPPLPTLDISSQKLPLLEFDGRDQDNDPGVSSAPNKTLQQEIERSYWPSASQIDENVLKELPLDIQEEIRSNMKKDRKATAVESVPIIPLESVETDTLRTSQEPGCSHWEPAHVQEPTVKMPVFKQAPSTPKKGKSPKKSPGKGRGRPRKGQTALLRSPAKDSLAVSRDSSKPTCDNLQNEEIELAVPATEPEPQAVSLCGAVTLSDVKQLLCQWLQDSPDPCDEDVERFLEYASDLVQSRNLEQLLLVLRYLRRLSKQHNDQWIKAAEQITKQTKAIVHSAYGSELKV